MIWDECPHSCVRVDTLSATIGRLRSGSRIEPGVIRDGNITLAIDRTFGALVASVEAEFLERDTKVEKTTQERTTKTTEKNRTTSLVCRGSVPVGIVDHLKMAIYPPVARYVRWAKQQERYRDDGGRLYGIRFCRWLIRHLKPRRFRIRVSSTTAITNRVENHIVEKIRIHRHVCPHIRVPDGNGLHFHFLAEPDHGKHYLVAFARYLVDSEDLVMSLVRGREARFGNILGFAHSVVKAYKS